MSSQVLWGRCVHQHPRCGCLHHGPAGHRAPDHPPGNRALLETCCPVWKCQGSASLPWHQDREHLCQNWDLWGHKNHRYRCIWGHGEGGPYLTPYGWVKWYTRTTTRLTHGRMMYNKKTQTQLETLRWSAGEGQTALPKCSTPMVVTGARRYTLVLYGKWKEMTHRLSNIHVACSQPGKKAMPRRNDTWC